MPVLLTNYQANIAVQAIKCHIQCNVNPNNNNNNNKNKRQLVVVGEKRTMSSKSSSKTGPQFQFTKEAANEDVNSSRTLTYCKEEQQMQMLLQQHNFLLQHFAFGEANNGTKLDSLYRISQPPTTSAALINLTPEDKHFHQLISNISHHQQQLHIQQSYGNMMPQPVNSLPIVDMENVALSTTAAAPAIQQQANNKPDIEALNDLTARIRQTSLPSMSLFEMYAKSPQLIQDVSSIKATTNTQTTQTIATSTSSLTAAPSSTILGIATKSHNFNMSLDPQYQLQRHQQQQQQQQQHDQQPQQKQPTKQDHEKQTILLRHNEMAHAIDSSKLPPAYTTTTESAATSSTTTKTSSEVASLVLTVATPPVDIQTLRANCKGG